MEELWWYNHIAGCVTTSAQLVFSNATARARAFKIATTIISFVQSELASIGVRRATKRRVLVGCGALAMTTQRKLAH
jgi:hypothetical protein